MKYPRTIICSTIACMAMLTPVFARDKPLKIYILAGQSNMQGTARPSTFSHMTLDPVSKPLHDKMVDEKGQPKVHDDIYITAVSQGGGWGGTTPRAKDGKLTVGFGGPLETDEMFGPELGFGVTMREQVGQPILLIKTAWGGKSLYTNFRPPSAGKRPVPEDLEARWKKSGKYEEELAKYHKASGHYYRLMMAHIKKVLADPGKYHPAYSKDAGYEVAGFAWFQGFNDQFEPYPQLPAPKSQKKKVKDFSEYTRLLSLFIKDVRKAVKTPDMPFAIGVIGVGGNPDKPHALRKAMAATADIPEFKGNVFAVQTAKYWDDELVEAAEKVAELWKIRNEAYTVSPEGKIDYDSVQTKAWQSVGTPSLMKRTWRYVSFRKDPNEQYRPLKKGEAGDERFFKEDVPTEYKGWQEPGFDASAWKEGPAPIGKGTFYKNRGKTVEASEVHSEWGDGNMLLMRTTVTLEPADYAGFRLCIMANQSYNLYLNGHKVATYVWWKKGLNFRAFELTEEQEAYLKKGENVLAVQANVTPGRNKQETNWVNLLIEGVTKEQQEKLETFYESVCTEKDKEIAKGKSNQAYHYLGSAKIYSRIGEALAKALIEIESK